jgi:hypothetical protein
MRAELAWRTSFRFSFSIKTNQNQSQRRFRHALARFLATFFCQSRQKKAKALF